MAKHKLQKEILQAVFEFSESCNVIRLSKSLRRMLFDYIAQNKDCLPIDFDRQLYEYSALLDLLECFITQNEKNTH